MHESIASHASTSGTIMRVFRKFRRTSVTFQLATVGALAMAILYLGSRLREDTIDENLLVKNIKIGMRKGDVGVNTAIHNSGLDHAMASKPLCGNREGCLVDQMAYRIQTGFENKHRPTICLDGNTGVFPQIEMGRGLNILHISGKTRQILSKRTYDTYQEDSTDLIVFLDSLPARDILIVVTFDDAVNRLSPEARKIFEQQFGSRQAHLLNYRAMWAFIGQKHVQHDGDHESISLHDPKKGEWGPQTEIKGCLSIPLGKTREPSLFDGRLSQNLCKVSRVCETNEVAVHAESGRVSKGSKLYPKVCFEGKTILSNFKIDDVKPARRGLNFLVVNPSTGQVVNSRNFDTYESAAQDIVAADFLRSVSDGMMVIGVTFDEASRLLGYNTKRQLQKLGSTKIQDLSYREMWAFVGQKGIDGASPYEKVSDDIFEGWGTKAEVWDCIPKTINGTKVGKPVMGLKKKTEFCQRYPTSFRDMCSPANMHKPIMPIDLDDETLMANLAYSTPIIVVPGSDLQALQQTLESLIAVPGIQNHLVVVVLEGNFAQPNELVGVYGFRTHYIKSKSQYLYTLQAGMEEAMGLFPKSEYFIIVEEYVTVAPDFLRYFSQTMHLLDQDTSLMTISAWNEHGFKHTSGDLSLLYRTDSFPGYGWVLRRSLWKAEIQKNELKCCADQTWREWLKGDFRKGRESVVPDVSRVKRSIKPGFYEDKPFLEDYLSNRTISNDPSTEPTRAFYLKQHEYEKYMKKLVTESTPLDRTLLIGCQTIGKTLLDLSEFARGIYSLFYRQDSADDYKMLIILAKCLRIYIYNEDTVRGLHKGVLRLTYQGQQLLLIGTKSPYYQYKPVNAVPF